VAVVRSKKTLCKCCTRLLQVAAFCASIALGAPCVGSTCSPRGCMAISISLVGPVHKKAPDKYGEQQLTMNNTKFRDERVPPARQGSRLI
jgi:hypothetical protein